MKFNTGASVWKASLRKSVWLELVDGMVMERMWWMKVDDWTGWSAVSQLVKFGVRGPFGVTQLSRLEFPRDTKIPRLTIFGNGQLFACGVSSLIISRIKDNLLPLY